MPDCYVVGAGDFNRAAFNPKSGDYIIAADGGYKTIKEIDADISLCVGDFDSLGFVPDCENVISVDPVEKDDTDVMLALKQGLKRGFKNFYILGGTGGSRADHTAANIQSLNFLAANGARGELIGMNMAATVIKNGSLRLSGRRDAFLSVFSLDAVSRGVTEKGLKYCLENGELKSDFPLGVSNRFTDETAEISVKDGTLLIMWELA